jgi:hypothetical protein
LRVSRYQKVGFLGILLGSPFALIGLIFMLRGKVGVGLPFLLLGLAPFLSGAVAGRKAASPADDRGTQPPASAGGEPAEPGEAADAGGGATSRDV